MEIFLYVLAVLMIVVGIFGVLLPSLPGILLSFGGVLIAKYFAGADIRNWWIICFGILTVISVVIDYLIPAAMVNKYGGTKWGNIGGYIGMFLGLISPIPMGFLIGMLVGVFVGELMNNASEEYALRSVKGALIGFFYSTGVNLVIGVVMLVVTLWSFPDFSGVRL